MQIIDDVNSRIPNMVKSETMVNWINQTQKRLFRRYEILSKEVIPTIEDQKVYDLPDDCSPEQITKVEVEGEEHYYYNLKDIPYYRILPSNRIELSSAPEADGLELAIIYNRKPADVKNSEDVPGLPEDYHEILVLDLCIRVAKVQQDSVLANAFFNDYEDVLGDMMIANYDREPEYPVTRDVMKKPRSGGFGIV